MASRSIGTLTIDLVTRTGLFEQGLDKAARTADRKFKDIAKSGAVIGTAIGGALAGLGALIAKNTMDSERELAQLDAILKSTGEAAGLTRDQLIRMSETLSSKSTFSSGEIVEAQTRLLSYSGVLGENIPRAMQAIIDQSARLGISVQQSAETIGRALESPAKAAAALSQQGFGAAFTKEVRGVIDALVAAGREGEAQILILEILEESYAGAAEAARNTFGGSLKALQNTINDLLTGSEGSLDGMTDAVNGLNEVLSSAETRAAVESLTNGIANMVRSLGPPLTKVLDGARIGFTALSDILEGLATQAIATVDVFNKLVRFDFSGLSFAIGEINRGRAQAIAALTADYSIERVDPRFAAVTGGVVRPRTPRLTNLPEPLDSSRPQRGGGKSDEQKEAESLQRSYESLMESMKERIALFNTEGETAKINYDLQYGSLKNLEEPLKENLRLEAERYDQLVKRREEDETRLRLAEEETDRINRALDNGRMVLEDIEFETQLMGLSNIERQKAIALWGLEAEAVERYGEAIGKAIEQRQLIEEQIELADGFRSAFTNAFEDIASGTKSVSDVFRDMLQDIADMITRFAAQKLVEQLFGAQGSTQSGSQGGWIQDLASIFAGGRANGGWIRPGQVAEVNERGMEMATVGGRDYLLTGGQPVKITPNHMMGGGVSLTVNNAFSEPTSTKTQTQIAARIAYEQRRAARFGA